MCGIAGIIGPASSLARVQAMCDAIAHRGPDAQGFHVEPEAALGNRRLSIIDLSSDGNQPIYNEDRSLVIVYNGEIYNYRVLRDRLLARGHKFRSTSDTEVILHLYEEDPHNFVSQLDGIFAIAIWDSTRRTLTLARDIFGIKPLHICMHGKELVFASEVKAIIASGLYTAKVNRQALHDCLNLRYIPTNDTLFEGVIRLPPACVAKFEDGKFAQRVYYRLTPRPTRISDLDQTLSRIEALLTDSIRSQLIADVPVGVYLSGGMDSSALVALRRRLDDKANIPTYNLSFLSERNEAPDAELVAKTCATQHQVIFAPRDALQRFKSVVWSLEEPKVNALQGFLLAEGLRGKIKVIHGGVGGDELFGGYRVHQFLMLAESFGRLIPRALSGAILAPLQNLSLALTGRSSLLSWGEGRRALDAFFGRTEDVERYLLLRNAWDVEKSNWGLIYGSTFKYKNLQPVRRVFEPLFAERGGGLLESSLFAEFHTKMINDLLLNEDRVSMAHGIELRVPFLSRELVECAFSVPAGSKLTYRESKSLLRRIFRRHLPAQILNKPKAGFQFDAFALFNSGLKELIEARLTESRVSELNYFEYAFIRDVLRAPSSPRLRWHYFLLWMMLGFDIWHELFIEGKR